MHADLTGEGVGGASGCKCDRTELRVSVRRCAGYSAGGGAGAREMRL
jgi:hypothetical protein